jgi:hypothetical protein
VPQVLDELARGRWAVLRKIPQGVMAHKVPCGTGIALPLLDGILSVVTEAYSFPCATAAAAESLAPQLQGGFVLDTPYTNRPNPSISSPLTLRTPGSLLKRNPVWLS